MITTGVITKINIDSGNHKNNKVSAEVSLFKIPSNPNPESFTCDCNCSVPGGIYSPYNVGDKVYIGFLNDEKTQPIILGKIYQGLEEEDRSYAYFNRLKVKGGVELPTDTLIGEINGSDLADFKTRIINLEDKVEAEASIRHTVLIKDPVTNFYGYKNRGYSCVPGPTDYGQNYTITYTEQENERPRDVLTAGLIRRYTRYMTGVAYMPGENLTRSETYRGGLIFADGRSGYLETTKLSDNDEYTLKIIMVQKQPFMTDAMVRQIIGEYLNFTALIDGETGEYIGEFAGAEVINANTEPPQTLAEGNEIEITNIPDEETE